ncbi:hypothetical protein ACIRN4_05245 [Pimelobacter simplex]|uniref:hypothetical protein n=1 Tax=Nocardioides simplex TaxID=2045 RepID=UPI00381006AD
MSVPTIRPLVRTLAAALAVAVSLALAVGGAGPAQAVNPYKPSGGPALRFVVDMPGATFTVVPSGVTTTCTMFTLNGVVEAPGVGRMHTTRAGYLDTWTTGGCGSVVVTPTGTWDVMITGDPTGTAWPARLRNAAAHGAAAGCSFDAAGDVIGTFDTGTQKFTATSSTLTLSGVTGPLCPLLDIAAGDGLDVVGTWTDLPPLGSGPFALGH